MTTFFADLRIYRLPDHHYATVSVELPANDLHGALALLQAWQAGLAVEPAHDTGFEESIYASKRRGVDYRTLKEASIYLRDNLFA